LGKDAFSAAENINKMFLDSTRLVGGSSEADMQNAIKTSKIIFTTYQFMGTGVSIPKLNSLILATPRKSRSRQYINRIFRLGSDYSITREIIDIVDTKVVLKSQWYKRRAYYLEQDYEISTEKYSYKDFI